MIDFIETYTGTRFRPLSPSASLISIKDIAHSLSQQCRFGGHTRKPYSVAEHSVRVCRRLHEQGCSKIVQLWGLLHDASEAYLVDIPAPLKHTPAFDAYRVAERALMDSICDKFYLPRDEPEEVLSADQTLLATEARDLMPHLPEHWKGLPSPLGERIEPWSYTAAKMNFLRNFEELYRD